MLELCLSVAIGFCAGFLASSFALFLQARERKRRAAHARINEMMTQMIQALDEQGPDIGGMDDPEVFRRHVVN